MQNVRYPTFTDRNNLFRKLPSDIEVIVIGNREIGVDEIVSASVGSKIVGLSERTLKDYGVKRLLPIYKIGNRNLFLVRDLLEFSECRRIESRLARV